MQRILPLGGLAGVRAYPSGEATGPQGQRLGVELRYLFNKSLIIKPFYDWGMVERRDPTSIGPSEYEISGAGLSASWSTPDRLQSANYLCSSYWRELKSSTNRI